MILDAKPDSLWSWNYTLRMRSRPIGSIRFYRMRDSGSVLLDDSEYDVDKQGMFSGSWDLKRGGRMVATAKKGMFRSGVEIDCDGEVFELARLSLFSSQFELRRGKRPVGSIRRAGWVTRAFTADLDDELPQSVRAFAMWLYAVLRRRNARQSS